MTYCVKCGKKLPEDTNFCPNCGASNNFERRSSESTINRIGRDRHLQEHWIKRIVALIIDSVLVGIATTILLIAFFLPMIFTNFMNFFNLLSFPFAMGIFYLLYFSLAETMYGSTLGKRMLGLKVIAVDGERPSFDKAFIRNLSKIYWVLLILDVIAGLLVSKDPNQKYSDLIAGTTVI